MISPVIILIEIFKGLARILCFQIASIGSMSKVSMDGLALVFFCVVFVEGNKIFFCSAQILLPFRVRRLLGKL